MARKAGIGRAKDSAISLLAVVGPLGGAARSAHGSRRVNPENTRGGEARVGAGQGVSPVNRYPPFPPSASPLVVGGKGDEAAAGPRDPPWAATDSAGLVGEGRACGEAGARARKPAGRPVRGGARRRWPADRRGLDAISPDAARRSATARGGGLLRGALYGRGNGIFREARAPTRRTRRASSLGGAEERRSARRGGEGPRGGALGRSGAGRSAAAGEKMKRRRGAAVKSRPADLPAL
ncbi:hypothetical protein KM043_003114 [Ampulex compressa]|nr:hypothetical protein KM043_003114 [Ampulex compressa]